MKKLIFSSLLGLALVAFTGCTKYGSDADASKCQTSKCDGAKKCDGAVKESVAKCQASAKCGK